MMKLITNKNFTKRPRKKIEIKRIRTKLKKKTIYKKLRLNDEIKINQTFTKRWRTKIRN